LPLTPAWPMSRLLSNRDETLQFRRSTSGHSLIGHHMSQAPSVIQPTCKSQTYSSPCRFPRQPDGYTVTYDAAGDAKNASHAPKFLRVTVPPHWNGSCLTGDDSLHIFTGLLRLLSPKSTGCGPSESIPGKCC
jgi:hypothetical protein